MQISPKNQPKVNKIFHSPIRASRVSPSVKHSPEISAKRASMTWTENSGIFESKFAKDFKTSQNFQSEGSGLKTTLKFMKEEEEAEMEEEEEGEQNSKKIIGKQEKQEQEQQKQKHEEKPKQPSQEGKQETKHNNNNNNRWGRTKQQHQQQQQSGFLQSLKKLTFGSQKSSSSSSSSGSSSSSSVISELKVRTSSVRTRRLMKEYEVLSRSGNKYFSVDLVSDCLDEWMVRLHRVAEDSLLHQDMQELGVTCISLSLSFPENFPFHPPFLRVLAPRLEKGFVMEGGAICMELLTPKGWASAYTIESIIMQFAASLVKGQGRICRKSKTGGVSKEFSRRSAETSFKSLVRTHERYGWVTPPLSEG